MSRRRVTPVEERLDGSLWVSHDGLCVPVALASADAGQLRACWLTPPSDRDLPAGLTELLNADKSLAQELHGVVVHRPRPDHPCCRYRTAADDRIAGRLADQVAGGRQAVNSGWGVAPGVKWAP